MAHRQMAKQVEKLFADTEDCTLCRKPFGHNIRTYSGVADTGALALVSECCVNRLTKLIHVGVYFHNKHGLYDYVGLNSGPIKTNEDAMRAVAKAQEDARELEKYFGWVERAGVRGRSKFYPQNSAWKDADREWFEQHPDRSHRAREPIEGEEESLEIVGRAVPPSHHAVVVVRQVEPGKRVRGFVYIPDHHWPIPDCEPLLHALTDCVLRATGKNFSFNDVCEIALAYARGEANDISDIERFKGRMPTFVVKPRLQ